MKNLRPVTMKDVVSGQPYTEMTVCLDGKMFLSRHVFYGRPVKRRHGWWFRTRRNNHGLSKKMDDPCSFSSVSDHGMDLGRGYENHHRTFRHTGRTEQILSDLVKRQALGEYLALIGFSNIGKELAVIKRRADQHREWNHFRIDFDDSYRPTFYPFLYR